MTLDLNADAGESYGVWTLGHDAELFGLLTSVNLACGFHAGDPLTIQRSVELARRHHLAIGAHPGFPDRVGFGRRELAATPEEVYADVLYQVGAVAAFLKAAGLLLHHVKAHGALYNRATRDAETARAIAQAVRDYDPALPLVVLPGTPLEAQAQAAGLRTVAEAFPERGYTRDGRLAPRGRPGAIIHDPREAARRAVSLALHGRVEAVEGGWVEVRPRTLCIHGDNPNAPQIARAVREALEAEGVRLEAF
jgi:UPF0271 protein